MTFAVDGSNSAARNLNFGTAGMVPQGQADVGNGRGTGNGRGPKKAEERMKKAVGGGLVSAAHCFTLFQLPFTSPYKFCFSRR